LIYVEKQRLRANLLTFAVTDRKSGDLAGIMRCVRVVAHNVSIELVDY
jgi:hypothetical protein